MKAWIGVYIRSSNQGFLNAVYNIGPHRLDNRLWDSDEYKLFRGTDMDGIEFVYMSLFFNDSNERDSFRSELGGINGFIHAALPGSYSKWTKCYHDEKTDDLYTKLDELQGKEIVV